MKIRAIVHTLSAWHRSNGYSSHRSMVTNTETGETLTFHQCGGRTNIAGITRTILRALNHDYEVYSSEADAPARVVDCAKDPRNTSHHYENDDGRRALAALFGCRMCETCKGEGRVSTGRPAQNFDNGQKPCPDCNRAGFVKLSRKPSKVTKG